MGAGRRTSAALPILMAACTAPNPLYTSDAAFCTIGTRQCLNSPNGTSPPTPVVCGLGTDGLTLLTDRCPTGAQCQDGLCVPPTGAMTCVRQKDCPGQSCVPLVNGDALGTFCISNNGMVAPGGACQADSDCQSFLCLQQSTGKFCLEVCQTAKDCGIPRQCIPFNVTVTGIQGSILSCSTE
jgi:hypothetical protein